jgi:hypothetical protein
MMGYRSQVACCISVDVVRKEIPNRTDVNGEPKYEFEYDKTKFKEMIGFIKLSRFYEIWTATEQDQKCFGWRNGKFIFYGNDFKWYPEFEDVKEFHKMFNQMQEVEGVSGYFLRVGEESGDVEEEQFGDDPCYDYFYSFSAMDFSGDEYLGKRETDEEVQTTQGEPNLPTPTSQGNA